jgi:hypothetical protein
MKKLLSAFLLCFLIVPVVSGQTISHDDMKEFRKNLNKKLSKDIHRYHDNSIQIIDMISLEGEVIKDTKQEGPKSEKNEKQSDKYTSQLMVALVEFEQKQDELLYFKNTELYFYDLENDEFLNYSNVYTNKEAESFFEKHRTQTGKEISNMSMTIFLLCLSTLLIVPILLMIFHNKSKSSTYYQDPDLMYFSG